MFSPSLVSMVFHSIIAESRDDLSEQVFPSVRDLARWLKGVILSQPSDKRWGEVPTIARGDSSKGSASMLRGVTQREIGETGGSFFWGRVPANQLVAAMIEFSDVPADREFVDLGTSLTEHAKYKSADDQCIDLLGETSSSPKAYVCIVDRGVRTTGVTPNVFNKKLKHVVTADIEVADHCKTVLSVLLERLQTRGIIKEVQIVCALVAEPTNPIGLACFDHANTVEMTDALDKLDKHLAGVTQPIAINLSMGTHVGPHNGLSPLEEFVTQMCQRGNGRAFHVSAGNDGLRDLSAQARVTPHYPEVLQVETGTAGCKEMLVEFWWNGDPVVQLDCAVHITNAAGTSLYGASGIPIGQSTAGKTLNQAVKLAGSSIISTLFSALCRQGMNCIAFAVSTTNPAELAGLEIDFVFSSNHDLVVNGWIVVCLDKSTRFNGSTSAATLNVPSTAANVICVAGLDRTDIPWRKSSRGPGLLHCPVCFPNRCYTKCSHRWDAPSLAYRASAPFGGGYGTSFSSPRACADSAWELLQAGQGLLALTPDKLIDRLLAKSGRNAQWLPRLGWGAVPG